MGGTNKKPFFQRIAFVPAESLNDLGQIGLTADMFVS